MKITILGAGISGLSLAWYLKKELPHSEITLIEKTGRVGGWIQTEVIDGFLFEFGPRGFLSSGIGAKTLALSKELGLELLKKDSSAKTRYLLTNGQLEALNFQLLWEKRVFPLLWKELKVEPTTLPDESVGDFFARRFNPSFVADFINPLVRGIYGGNPYQLSLRTSFPKWYQLEKEYGSMVKGFLLSPKQSATLYSFKGGMESLPQTLYRQLLQKGVKFSFHQEYTSDHETDQLISTLPSKEIPYLSLTTVQIGFREPLLQKKGYGYLASSKEEEIILGMTFDSNCFPQQGSNTRLCLMLKGEIEEKEAQQLALRALRSHLNISTPPDQLVVRQARGAIPQYPVNHIAAHPFGVGVNACIAQAEAIALTFKLRI